MNKLILCGSEDIPLTSINENERIFLLRRQESWYKIEGKVLNHLLCPNSHKIRGRKKEQSSNCLIFCRMTY